MKLLVFDLTDHDAARASLRAEKAEFFQLTLWEMREWLIEQRNQSCGDASTVYDRALQRLLQFCERYNLDLED